MALVRWNPWREMSAFQRHVNHCFEDSFNTTERTSSEPSMSRWSPAVDIYDDEGTIVIKAELPGVDKKDITIDVKDRVLTLKGERSDETEVKEDSFYRRERVSGTFQRAFTLPALINAENIKADFKDGVLKIDIPKPEEEKPKQVTIH